VVLGRIVGVLCIEADPEPCRTASLQQKGQLRRDCSILLTCKLTRQNCGLSALDALDLGHLAGLKSSSGRSRSPTRPRKVPQSLPSLRLGDVELLVTMKAAKRA
jgi:hypothetical protein